MTNFTRTVYAVCSGYYSDYKVHALFENRSDAEKAATAGNDDEECWGDLHVEPHVMFEQGDPCLKVTSYHLYQEFHDTGELCDGPRVAEYTELWFNQFCHITARPTVRFVRAPSHKGQGGRLEVRGTDRQAVIQAANDYRAIIQNHRDLTGKVGPVREIWD